MNPYSAEWRFMVDIELYDLSRLVSEMDQLRQRMDRLEGGKE